jgi:pyridoxal phosphate enzyme (YggS family)
LSRGLSHVAESFAQEARDKIPQVEAMLRETGTASPRWHFVGQLQRNKARYVARLFDCVESVDRIELARELDHRAALSERHLDVLVQVNLAREAQKGGVAPDRVAPLLEECRSCEQIRVTGLMTVPPASEDPEASRPVFAALRQLRAELREQPGGETLRELSMGMSADFEVAIEEGATIVRVGTAIFGPRE